MDVVAYKRPPIVGLPLYMKSLQGSIQGLEERAISWGETLTNLGLNEVDLCVLYVCYAFIYMLLRYAKTHSVWCSISSCMRVGCNPGDRLSRRDAHARKT